MVPISTPRCLSPSRPFSEPPPPPNPGVYGAGRSPEKPPPLPSADSVSAEARPGPPPPASPQPVLGLLDETLQLLLAELHLRGGHRAG